MRATLHDRCIFYSFIGEYLILIAGNVINIFRHSLIIPLQDRTHRPFDKMGEVFFSISYKKLLVFFGHFPEHAYLTIKPSEVKPLLVSILYRGK